VITQPEGKSVPTKVGELFKVVGGGTPSTANPDFWKGSIPWITSADLDDHFHVSPRKSVSYEAIAASATNLIPVGSVVVATRVGLGKVGIAESELCFSQDCQGIILDPKVCDSKFAALQLKIKVQVFKHTSRGTTIAGVTKKQLLDLPFDLPCLDEQHRIVAEIEKQFTRLDAGVAGLWRMQTNLKRYRAAVLKAACEGKLVPTEAELARQEGRSYETGPNFSTAFSLNAARNGKERENTKSRRNRRLKVWRNCLKVGRGQTGSKLQRPKTADHSRAPNTSQVVSSCFGPGTFMSSVKLYGRKTILGTCHNILPTRTVT
jgi:restriction endonuclease S subunit